MIRAVGFLVGSVRVGEVLKVVKREGGWGYALRGGRCALVGGVLFAEEKGTFSQYRKNVPLGGESQ